MGIFEKLPDKELLESYIEMYAGYDNVYGKKPAASLPYLMRFWDEAKSTNLYKLLGEQFIVEREMAFNKPMSEIENDITRCLSYGSMYSFYEKFQDWVNERYEKSDGNDIAWSEHCVLMGLIESRNLARSEITCRRTYKIEIGDSVVAIQNGAKPVRILSKFAKLLNLEDEFERFRIELSRILNDSYVKGTMCLSIHPLDYITMSDNPYDWESCMNWMNEGQYRMGTVEMMNSPVVVVAYLKGEKPLRFAYDNYWNGKKWRNLFIVTRDFVTSVKGYPYQSYDFDHAIMKWIKELAETNLGWKYRNYIDYSPDSNDDAIYLEDDGDGEYRLNFNFETGVMYNDFGNNNNACIMLRKNFFDDSIYCYYSGKTECMYCGSELCSWQDYNEDLADTGCVICNNCMEAVRCECCGDRVRSADDLYELDGEMMCENCYNDNAVDDTFTGETHNKNNCTLIYALSRAPKENEDVDTYRMKEIWFYDSVDDYIKDIHRHTYKESGWWWSNSFDYITPDDLTEEGKKFFERNCYRNCFFNLDETAD